MFAFSQQSSMKTFCFVSNSYSFLSSYKSSLSQLLLSTGDRVVWYVPYQELVKSSLSSSYPFPIKSSSNSRSGILSFIQLYFFFIIKLLSTPSSVYISHTVYPNIALMLAVLSVPFHRQSHHVFVSGFGPSRIQLPTNTTSQGSTYYFFAMLQLTQNYTSTPSIITIIT